MFSVPCKIFARLRENQVEILSDPVTVNREQHSVIPLVDDTEKVEFCDDL